jgi:phosphatidylserine decarboxylase
VDPSTSASATRRARLDRILQQEDINFLLTNRLPRRLATRFMGWFSRIEQPLVRDMSLAVWRLCAGDLALGESRTTDFRSLHECFTRQLKPGARPIHPDPHVLTSPCDAIVGAMGRVEGAQVFQAKGFPYTLDELVGDAGLVEPYRDGSYVTLRLTSTMYHRFHAPGDSLLNEVTYISGDTWNVNPIALARVERLFCRNERAVLPMTLAGGDSLLLVPVAAILVASIRLHFLPVPLNLAYRGPNRIACRAAFRKGEEMGYFEHGSTILVFATKGLALHPHLRQGRPIRMGEPLLMRQWGDGSGRR